MKFKGTVIKGLQVGAKFGVATANISLKEEINLEEGVYFVFVYQQISNEIFVQQKRYNGILHFGELKTFGREQTCEVHLLNFDENIYGKTLEIEILKFHRKIKKFQNADALYTQIEKDVIIAEKYFVRKNIYEKWEKISEDEKIIFEKKSLEKIGKNSSFLKSKNVFIYAPQRHREICFTEKLMKIFPEKKYFFPKISDKNEMIFLEIKEYEDLVIGKYDILEPPKTNKTEKIIPDIIFIPAVAADKELNRLGKGGGFYDRFLDKVESQTLCVLPEFAIEKNIPIEAHDKKTGEVLVIANVDKI